MRLFGMIADSLLGPARPDNLTLDDVRAAMEMTGAPGHPHQVAMDIYDQARGRHGRHLTPEEAINSISEWMGCGEGNYGTGDRIITAAIIGGRQERR